MGKLRVSERFEAVFNQNQPSKAQKRSQNAHENAQERYISPGTFEPERSNALETFKQKDSAQNGPTR